jgi:hypothetical protein
VSRSAHYAAEHMTTHKNRVVWNHQVGIKQSMCSDSGHIIQCVLMCLDSPTGSWTACGTWLKLVLRLTEKAEASTGSSNRLRANCSSRVKARARAWAGVRAGPGATSHTLTCQ